MKPTNSDNHYNIKCKDNSNRLDMSCSQGTIMNYISAVTHKVMLD